MVAINSILDKNTDQLQPNYHPIQQAYKTINQTHIKLKFAEHIHYIGQKCKNIQANQQINEYGIP